MKKSLTRQLKNMMFFTVMIFISTGYGHASSLINTDTLLNPRVTAEMTANDDGSVLMIATADTTTSTSTSYGIELIQGGGNDNGALDPAKWNGVGMSYNGYVGIYTYQNNDYIDVNPLANHGGAYQAITTEAGKSYLLRATLIGSNHYTDINNYTLGSSYITVEDIVPTPTTAPNYVSNSVTGATPVTVEREFTATSDTTYIALRGDRKHRYPKMSMISVKKILSSTTPPPTTTDTTRPIIILQGDNPVNLTVGDTYAETGATASDDMDGNVEVIITGSVDTNKVGTYTITYTATDAAGNESILHRTVIVEEENRVQNSIKILTIGDSFTDGADYLKPLVGELTSSGYSNITFVGTREDQGISHEGRAGWDASGYLNLNPRWYPDSPFLNHNSIDFPYYFQEKLRVQPDIVIIQLGVNDVISATKGVIRGYYEEDSIIEEKISDITLLANHLRESLPQAKILMMMPTEQNENNETNTNAEAIGITDKDLYRELMGEYQEQYLAKFDNREEEGIYVLKTYEYLDTMYDFRDFVHPNATGYDEIAEALIDKLLSLVSSVDQPEEVPATPTLGKKIFEIDFNKHPIGKYTKAMHKEDFYTYQGENLYYKNHDGSWMYGASGAGESLSIIKDGQEKVLRVLYKKGKIHLGDWQIPSTWTGSQSLAALPKENRPEEDPYNPQEVTLIYYVKFENGFDWAIGGKLPGLAGGVAPAGGQRLGNHKMQNGFTARFMWHMLKSASDQKVPGLIGYIYHPGRSGNTGQFIYGAGSYMSTIKPTTSFTDRDNTNLFVFEREKWYKITQTIQANTPYKSDGTMKVWIDDKLATSYGGMKYIADGKHGKYSVDRFLFSTFYGGSGPGYAPNRDAYARFKDIQVYVK